MRTATPHSRWGGGDWVVLGVTLATAVLVRLVPLEWPPLGFREGQTVHAIHLDWIPMVKDRLYGAHSPCYFALVKLIAEDGAVYSVRLLSAIFSVATCMVLALVGRRFFGTGGFLGFPLGFLLCDQMAFLGYLARPHVMLLPFTAVFLYGALALLRGSRALFHPRFTRHPGFTRQRCFVVAAVLLGGVGAGWTVNSAQFVWLAVDGAVLGILALRRRWRSLGVWLALMLVRAVLWAPLALLMSASVSSHAGNWWPGKVGWAGLRLFIEGAYLWRSDAPLPALLSHSVQLACLATAAYGCIQMLRSCIDRAIVLASLSVVPALALLAASLHTPMLIDRYAAPAAMAAWMLFGFGAVRLCQSGWQMRLTLAGVVLLLALRLATSLWGPHQRDFRDAVAALEAHARPPIGLTGKYLGVGWAVVVQTTLNVEPLDLADIPARLTLYRELWILDINRPWPIAEATEPRLAEAGWSPDLTLDGGWYRLTRFRRHVPPHT